MPVEHETSTRFMDEVAIISPWAYFYALLGFLVVAAAVVFARITDKTGAPFYSLAFLVPLGILAGIVMACYCLLIGYINRDAGRRGMSRISWTLLAICIPNGLGIVLYFVLRKPRALTCPQCTSVVESGFGFCPRCRCRLNAICPQCQRGVKVGDTFCPYCGRDLRAGGSAVSLPVATQS